MHLLGGDGARGALLEQLLDHRLTVGDVRLGPEQAVEVAAVAHLDAELELDLPQVRVEGAVDAGEALGVVRLQQQVDVGWRAHARSPLSELRPVSVMRTSTNCPISDTAPSKLTVRLLAARPAICPPPRRDSRSTSTRCVLPTSAR